MVVLLVTLQLNKEDELSQQSDWLRTGRAGFDSRGGNKFSLHYHVQTDSEAYPAYYQLREGDEVYSGRSVTLFTSELISNLSRRGGSQISRVSSKLYPFK